jgi:apolipoprotein N-acyltransferase
VVVVALVVWVVVLGLLACLASFLLFLLDVLRALFANGEWIREMFGFDGEDSFGWPFAGGSGAIG